MLPAFWGRASSLRWRIIGEAGAVSLLVLPTATNELQAAIQGSPPQPAGASGCGLAAIAL